MERPRAAKKKIGSRRVWQEQANKIPEYSCGGGGWPKVGNTMAFSGTRLLLHGYMTLSQECAGSDNALRPLN
ncbi:unnamed protein product [Linum trigynum]|uniref:Uncharacterized protein n=1 Tax=Linum trigynum TaxID=586398 RepID=A0AAV2EVA3_9ROSI